jgi:hypothetical protein
MKKCENCGRESGNKAAFCQFCGAKFPPEDSSLSGEYFSGPQGGQNTAPPLPEQPAPPEVHQQDGQSSAKPPNKGLVWLIVSSIVTFFGCCCLPLGFLQIGAIVTSAISVSKYNKGDYAGSEQLARVSMIIFFSVLALSVILMIVFIATGYYADIFDTYSEFYSEYY